MIRVTSGEVCEGMEDKVSFVCTQMNVCCPGSHQLFRAARIALKLESGMSNAMLVLQVCLNFSYLSGATHKKIIHLYVRLEMNVGIIHLPEMNVVHIPHAGNGFHRSLRPMAKRRSPCTSATAKPWRWSCAITVCRSFPAPRCIVG
jgi:hypothetical protein